jgi:hypothetical protein
MPEESGLNVRLMVYSGRPDPGWELSEPESGQVVEAVFRGVREGIAVGRPADPGLGYRGFLVTPNGKIEELGDQVVINRRVITRTTRKTSEFFVDIGGAEQILLRQAREHGQAEVLAALGVEVDSE